MPILKLCSECKRLVDGATLRSLARTQRGGNVRHACPECFARVVGLRKAVRESLRQAVNEPPADEIVPQRDSFATRDVVSVSISRQEFGRLKNQFEWATPLRNKQDATLSFANGKLGIRSAGVSVAIAASGSWRGIANVPLAFILSAVRTPPAEDPMLVTVREGRLHIGNSSITCRWRALRRAQPQMLAGHAD